MRRFNELTGLLPPPIWMLMGLILAILFPYIAGTGSLLDASIQTLAYVIMALGLNIVVGFAGLLDLGFVAFFAVGAYTTALLTADAPHALAHLPYWAAMPLQSMIPSLPPRTRRR